MTNLFDNLVARSLGENIIQPRIPSRYENWEDMPDDRPLDEESVSATYAAQASPTTSINQPILARDEPTITSQIAPSDITTPARDVSMSSQQVQDDEISSIIHEQHTTHTKETVIEREQHTLVDQEHIVKTERPIIEPLTREAREPAQPARHSVTATRQNTIDQTDPVQPAPMPIEPIPQIKALQQQQETHVSVSIGRIEVRMPQAPPPKKPEMPKAHPKPAFQPAMSLSDYMKKQRK